MVVRALEALARYAVDEPGLGARVGRTLALLDVVRVGKQACRPISSLGSAVEHRRGVRHAAVRVGGHAHDLVVRAQLRVFLAAREL